MKAGFSRDAHEYLDDLHGVQTFGGFLSDEAPYPPVLHLQTGVLLTGRLQQPHKVLIYQHVLQKIPTEPCLQ